MKPELIHYCGDGAAYCKDWKRGEPGHFTTSVYSVNCPNCLKILNQKGHALTNRAFFIITLAILLFFIANVLIR